MAIFKCKMCGGELSFNPGESTGVCDYCGQEQTLPKVMDENLQGLFNRANVLRMKAEFDKAGEIYEKILQNSDTEAEAYWGLILCKYGIEYVEDPATFKRVPTCHRASYEAVTADDDYKMALQYADTTQRVIYEAEAKQIDEIQKGIIALAQKEEPYDVFICYKESDDDGKRTQDSVIANDIYYQLTQEGFKVFYAAITLEDKLGQEYEPYIFSALNSARVMLSIGTKPEYFNAVWVKNEWSRFLKIMKKDRARVLIPCFRDMDAYELPEEFAHLQAQDMGKIGFINDVVRGIKKVLDKGEAAKTPEPVVVQQNVGGTNADAQIKRGNMALEDGDWSKANDFFEEALNLDPECAEAYIGKFLAEQKASNLDAFVTAIKAKYATAKEETLVACKEETEHIAQSVKENIIDNYVFESRISGLYKFDITYVSALKDRTTQKETGMPQILENKFYIRAKQFASGETQQKLDAVINDIQTFFDTNIQNAKKQNEENIERIKAEYEKHIQEADEKAKEIHQKGLDKKESDYQNYIKQFETVETIVDVINIKNLFEKISNYKDVADYLGKCNQKLAELEEQGRKESEKRKQKEKRAKTKKIGIRCAVIAVVVALIIAAGIINKNNHKAKQYNKAISLMKSKKYDDARKIFVGMKDYKKSKQMISKCVTGNPHVGDVFTFGKNKWIALKEEKDHVLIISENAVAGRAYNESYGAVTWETCSLRQWLNNDYLNDTFSKEEQEKIELTKLGNLDNTEYDTSGGNDTEDKIFLLSIGEANGLFKSDGDRICRDSAGKACFWWLRSPGYDSRDAAYVNSGGSVSTLGGNVNYDGSAVRPALWINLKS